MNFFLSLSKNLNYNNNPQIAWAFWKNLNQTKRIKLGGYEGILSKVALISHFKVFFVGFSFPIQAISYHLHIFHMHTSRCEWRFASPHPSWSIYGHCVGCSQRTKTKCPKLAKKIRNIKKGFHTFNFPFASDWRWLHFTWALMWTQTITFWSFHHWITYTSLIMHAFI